MSDADLMALYASGASIRKCAMAANQNYTTMRRRLLDLGVALRVGRGQGRQSPDLRTRQQRTLGTLRHRVAALEGAVRYWKGKAKELEDINDQWEARWAGAVIRWRKQTGLTRVA